MTGGGGGVATLVAAGVLVGLALPTTTARWVAQRSVVAPSVGSGSLDLTVEGALVGSGGTVTVAGPAITPAGVPGESVATELRIANAGSAAFTWTATGTASGTLAPSLLESVTPGGVATNTGTAQAGTRQGSCSGAPTYGPATLGGSATAVVATPRALAPGASETLCVVVAVRSDAPSSAQGATGAPTFVLTAQQVPR